MEWAAAWQSCMERGRRCGCWRRCWRRGAERALSLNGRALLVRWEPLGEGAFSSVYACCDASTGEPFAIKEMLCQSAEQLSAARAEVRIHRKVGRHPGLLPLIDACELEAGPRGAIIVALLMPLFTRGTLFDLLQRQAATSNAASVGLGGGSGSGGGGWQRRAHGRELSAAPLPLRLLCDPQVARGWDRPSRPQAAQCAAIRSRGSVRDGFR